MKNQAKHFLFVLLFICLPVAIFGQKQFVLASPDGRLKADIEVGQTVSYSISHDTDLVLDKSAISMTLSDGAVLAVQPKIINTNRRTVNAKIDAVIYKKKQVEDNFNELSIKFKGDYQVIFRAYNDGVAYRFVYSTKKPFIVESELAEFNFPSDNKAYIAYTNRPEGSFESQYYNSFEQPYHHIPLSQWNKKRLGISPLLVEAANNKKVCITEADLINYPGMFLYNWDGGTSIKGVFAPYPKDVVQGGHNQLQGVIKSRESYIAKFDGATTFPWRVVIVAEKDSDLLNSDMVYKLATPTQGEDFSWVKPGKVAWDWWNTWNLYGVDFESGINNQTYKYYIDFASKYGIEYVILDEGWAVNLQADLMQVVPEIDLKELVAYANNKNVGLILWAGYHAFNRDMENVCKHYSEMGIKGFKVDFMDRDDQPMVDFHYRTAQMAAKYRMLIDFHGTYKPTGLQRTYPNVINFEGVFGLEQMKWYEGSDQVDYDVTMPFIRMVSGPIDYTQGAMRNATKGNYRAISSEAMSQGTRCRQLAEYIVFESPLNMLCDSPSNYMNEQECTEFIAAVPTTWDETIALDGKVGEYVAIARKKGAEWFVGAMTNWDARTVQLDLSFLGEGTYHATVFRDGVNADKAARDYKKETIDISSDKKLTISMAKGGGYVLQIRKAD